jgi:hypothetical protein
MLEEYWSVQHLNAELSCGFQRWPGILVLKGGREREIKPWKCDLHHHLLQTYPDCRRAVVLLMSLCMDSGCFWRTETETTTCSPLCQAVHPKPYQQEAISLLTSTHVGVWICSTGEWGTQHPSDRPGKLWRLASQMSFHYTSSVSKESRKGVGRKKPEAQVLILVKWGRKSNNCKWRSFWNHKISQAQREEATVWQLRPAHTFWLSLFRGSRLGEGMHVETEGRFRALWQWHIGLRWKGQRVSAVLFREAGDGAQGWAASQPAVLTEWRFLETTCICSFKEKTSVCEKSPALWPRSTFPLLSPHMRALFNSAKLDFISSCK